MNYFDIIDKLKTHFESDPIINTVTQGDIFEIDLGKMNLFPLMTSGHEPDEYRAI